MTKIVKTNDMISRGSKTYEVVIADDNIFVACPVKYSRKEKSNVVNYARAEIYANQKEINTLEDLRFIKL